MELEGGEQAEDPARHPFGCLSQDMMLADIGIRENVKAPPCSSEDSLAVESPQVFRVYAPCSEVTDAENTNLAGEFKEPFCMSGVLQHVSKYMQL
jgi:hypothetical protein